jgi:hypothetical protein
MSTGTTPAAASSRRFSVAHNRGSLLLGVALLVLSVLAATLGANVGHREPARLIAPTRATAGEVSFVLTRDYVRSLDVGDATALGLRDPLNLVDVGFAPAGVLAGRDPHPDPRTLLPRSLPARHRVPATVGGVRGWRYPDVAVPDRMPHAEVIAVPAAAGGSIVLVCDVPLLGRADCGHLIAQTQLAGSADERAARGVARVLVPQMRGLRRTEARLSATAATAPSARGRAAALRGLGAAYARTADALRDIPAATALSRSLSRLAAGYRDLAHAARGGTRAGVIFARSEVSLARADVARAFARIAGRN